MNTINQNDPTLKRIESDLIRIRKSIESQTSKILQHEQVHVRELRTSNETQNRERETLTQKQKREEQTFDDRYNSEKNRILLEKTKNEETQKRLETSLSARKDELLREAERNAQNK